MARLKFLTWTSSYFDFEAASSLNFEVSVMSVSDFEIFVKTNGAAPAEKPEFEDTSILCIDCSATFIWSAGEQAFFRDKQLKNPPKRCKLCKQAKNDRLAVIANAQANGVKQRIEVSVNCARCSAPTTVPFYPSQGRPVYCRSCFLELNPSVLNPAAEK